MAKERMFVKTYYNPKFRQIVLRDKQTLNRRILCSNGRIFWKHKNI